MFSPDSKNTRSESTRWMTEVRISSAIYSIPTANNKSPTTCWTLPRQNFTGRRKRSSSEMLLPCILLLRLDVCPCVECFRHPKPLCIKARAGHEGDRWRTVLLVRAFRFAQAYETYLDEVSDCLRTYNAELMTSTASGPSSTADTVMAAVPLMSTARQSARQRFQSILQGTLATFTTMDLEIGKTLFLLIVEMLVKACFVVHKGEHSL